MQCCVIHPSPKETCCLEGNGEILYWTLVDGIGIRNWKASSCFFLYSHDISRNIWNLLRHFKIYISSSSFYWASVANAPNVLKPYWLIVLLLDVPDLTASLLLWGPNGQRWRCLWTFLFFFFFANVPTFATGRLQETLAAKGGTTWTRNGRWILPEMPDFHVTFWDLLHAVNLRHGTNGFTSLPKEGVLRIFSPWKILWLRPGLNPRTWVPKANTLPLDHRRR